MVASKQGKEILLLEGHKEKLSCFQIDVRGTCTVDCAMEDSNGADEVRSCAQLPWPHFPSVEPSKLRIVFRMIVHAILPNAAN